MKTTRFSVSVCVYCNDDPAWFKTAMESVSNQTVPPDEVVLVVDGPVTDGLDAVISHYESLDCFKVVRLPENQGHGNARRIGLETCSNEIVALMDSDDISLPDRFEKQIGLFERDDELSVVGGNIAEFSDNETNTVGIRTVPCSDEEIKSDLKTRCPFNQVSVMFRKSHIQKAGGYLDWFCNEDYYLWIRMYLAGMKFANVPEVLVNVRVGADMYKRRGGWKYFSSEFGIQNYMLKHRVISFPTYLVNVAKRFAVQVMLPNRLRGFVYKKFARAQSEN